jgi:hypothetical protein
MDVPILDCPFKGNCITTWCNAELNIQVPIGIPCVVGPRLLKTLWRGREKSSHCNWDSPKVKWKPSLHSLWDHEVQKAAKDLRPPKLTKVLIKCYWKPYAVLGIFTLIEVCRRKNTTCVRLTGTLLGNSWYLSHMFYISSCGFTSYPLYSLPLLLFPQ